MGYVGDDLLRWGLRQLNEWRADLPKVRGRQTFPRFLVLKRLGMPSDGSLSQELSTADFHAATEELFGVATGAEASTAGLGTNPLYLNPFTGDYQRADPGSDWAVGTLWTRSDIYAPITYTVVGTGSGNQRRRFQVRENYLDLISSQLGTKIPLLPLIAFLGSKAEPWAGAAGGGTGFQDLDALRAAVVAGLGLTQAELDKLFDTGAQPPMSLQAQALTRPAILQVVVDEVPFAATPAPTAAAPAVAALLGLGGEPDWSATISGDDPCGLKGLGAAFRKAQAALAVGKHVVFYGPPGTGKSQLAECLARTLKVEFIITTATSDWTTFDTIGGYFPQEHNGEERLSFLPGLLVESLAANRWVIIDELNRADIDKAFGQLFSILSRQKVTLPYLDRSLDPVRRVSIGPSGSAGDAPTITVPDDWRLIGTMNTFDKSSLFQLSYALMRRFAFVEVPAPEGAVLEEIMGSVMEAWPKDGREEVGERLIRVFCAPSGLRSAGCEVGAAIPLDICTAIGKAPAGDIDDDEVLELLDMYLFPQFEGKERDHPKLFDALKSTLELDEQGVSALQRKLAAWTGHRS